MRDLPNNRPGHRQRLRIAVGRWKRSTISVDETIEEYSIAGDDSRELIAALLRLKESPRPVKILTVSARNVNKAALLSKRLGVRGLVRDRSGLILVPVR